MLYPCFFLTAPACGLIILTYFLDGGMGDSQSYQFIVKKNTRKLVLHGSGLHTLSLIKIPHKMYKIVNKIIFVFPKCNLFGTWKNLEEEMVMPVKVQTNQAASAVALWKKTGTLNARIVYNGSDCPYFVEQRESV